jgi:MerR family transcriptional regulator, mercuric resistance operon regulatory protein
VTVRRRAAVPIGPMRRRPPMVASVPVVGNTALSLLDSTCEATKDRVGTPVPGQPATQGDRALYAVARSSPGSVVLDLVLGHRADAGAMRTSEVADRAGVNMQTLRYYERRGLLNAPPRTPAGYRQYPSSAVSVLRFIKRAQQLGFSLGEIEELLNLAEGGPDNCDGARALADAHMAELDRKIADLTRMQDSLRELIATCARPRADRSCPLLQAMHDEAAIP